MCLWLMGMKLQLTIVMISNLRSGETSMLSSWVILHTRAKDNIKLMERSVLQVWRRLTRSPGAAVVGRVLRRKEAVRRATAARENRVALTRQYRQGELPDIKSVQLASFFDPLGASLAGP